MYVDTWMHMSMYMYMYMYINMNMNMYMYMYKYMYMHMYMCIYMHMGWGRTYNNLFIRDVEIFLSLVTHMKYESIQRARARHEAIYR